MSSSAINFVYRSLRSYHNLDGTGNGSPIQGVQLPPMVADVADLPAYLKEVAKAVGSDPRVAMVPRTESREDIRQLCSQSVRIRAHWHIELALQMIQNPAIAQITRQAVEAAPKEFWTASGSPYASSHPADEFNCGGLALHSLRDAIFGDILTRYYHITGDDRDRIIAALVLHDIQKGKTFAFEHAHDGEDWLKNDVWSADELKLAGNIPHLVGMHMAQWNRPAPTLPRTLEEQVVSWSDSLGSRPDMWVDPVLLPYPAFKWVPDRHIESRMKPEAR